MKQKILIFTDSRGDYKASFTNNLIFPEKIKKNYSDKYDVDLMLCPFKWTTTLDFLDLIDKKIIIPENYKYIILYTGIVDHSPRPIDNALNNIYKSNVKDKISFDVCIRGSMSNKSKIINEKKYIFDKIFGLNNMTLHLNNPFDIYFENKKTINMYSIEMMEKFLIPKLNSIHNLIYINSNRILDNWDGNFSRSRPRNIKIIEKYSSILANKLNNIIGVINILKWNDAEIKKYTIDNMHLTYEGSEYIYNELTKFIK